MRRFWALLIVAPMAGAQVLTGPLYNQTDVISNNSIALTNKTVDCNLNTCTNIPAAGFSAFPQYSILCNNTGGTAIPTTCTAFRVQNNLTYAGTLLPTIWSQGNVGGTVTSGSAFFNEFALGSDAVNTTGGGGPGGATILYVGDTINAANMTGNRTGVTSLINITGHTGNTHNTTLYYTGSSPRCQASVADNGANSDPSGNCFGTNPGAILSTGATFWNSVVGSEVDIGVETGASVLYKVGEQIVIYNTDTQQGSLEDAGLVFDAQASSVGGWKNLIQIGSPKGRFPVNGGSVMTTASTSFGGAAYSVAHGIDFSGLTCTSDCFKSTGFLVDGSGDILSNSVLWVSTTAPTINSGFNTSGTPPNRTVVGVSTAAFEVIVGTGTGTSTGVLTMPTASNGWHCSVSDDTTPATHMLQQTANTTTSVTVTDYSRTAGTAQNMANSDKLTFTCGAF